MEELSLSVPASYVGPGSLLSNLSFFRISFLSDVTLFCDVIEVECVGFGQGFKNVLAAPKTVIRRCFF